MYMVHKILSHNDGSDAVQKMQKKQLKNRFIKPPKPIGSFFSVKGLNPGEISRGEGDHLGIFWVGMCRPGLQIGTPF